MNTVESSPKRKIKTVEIKHSNMSFIVEGYSHFLKDVYNPHWTITQYTAIIKETGESIGMMGGRELIRKQMEIINSRPDLYLRPSSL